MESNYFETTQEQAQQPKKVITRRGFLTLMGGAAAATVLGASEPIRAAKKEVSNLSAASIETKTDVQSNGVVVAEAKSSLEENKFTTIPFRKVLMAKVPDTEAELLQMAGAIYSASRNTWMMIPNEVVMAVAGAMDGQTSQTINECISLFLSIAERDGGDSAFNIKENLIHIAENNVDPAFALRSVGNIVDIRSDRTGYTDDTQEVIYEDSHFGGITIYANQESSLHITVPSKDGPVPQIDNDFNITAGTVDIMKFGRYGDGAAQFAKGYLESI